MWFHNQTNYAARCPNPEDLKAFDRGRLPSSVCDTIASHLESCDRCTKALHSLAQGEAAACTRPIAYDNTTIPLQHEAGCVELRDRALALWAEGRSSGPPVTGRQKFSSPLPTTLGPYELLQVLGHGGTGVVYRARQTRLNRLVAVKVLKADYLSGSEELLRFQAEALKLAQLKHPNIVQVYDHGEEGNRPYFSLELVEGGSLAGRLAGTPQDPPKAARLIHTLAKAMAYAHQQGIIHRDLKPSNVLLTLEDVPKISDFGLAKTLGSQDEHTKTGTLLGSPPYMAPEQATGNIRGLGPHTDVYGLGAIFYELLTGRPPFQGATPLETVQQVLNLPPIPPRRLNPAIPRDLETVCLTCLRKESWKRYAGAKELAEDLSNFLERRPIRARPVSRAEQAYAWCRRNPALAIAGSVVAALLVVITAGSIAWGVNARKLYSDVQTALNDSELRRAENHLDRGLMEAEHGDVGLGLLWMARGLETAPDQAEFAWTVRANLTGWRHRLFALTNCCAPPDRVLGFDPDGRIAWVIDEKRRVVRGWEITTQRYLGPDLQHPQWVMAFCVSRDGKWLATACNDRQVRVWEATSGRLLRAIDANAGLCGLAFGRDSRTVVVANRETRDDEPGTAIHEWEIATGSPVGAAFRIRSPIDGLALSPDGCTLLTFNSLENEVRRWEMPSGRLVGVAVKHEGAVRAVAFSPDGLSILTGGNDGAARLWNASSGDLLQVLHHQKPVTAVAFDSRGDVLLTAGLGEPVRLWHGSASVEPLQCLVHPRSIRCMAVSTDGKWLATGSDDGSVLLWKLDSGKPVSMHQPLPHRSALSTLAFSPDGKLLATSTHVDPGAWLWDVASGALHAYLPHDSTVRRLVFSPDGSYLATAERGLKAQLWHTATGRRAIENGLMHNKEVGDIAFSHDGRIVATGGEDGLIHRWEVATGALLEPALKHGSFIWVLTYSPDGSNILSGGEDGVVRRWESTTGKLLEPGFQHGYTVWTMAFTPNGRIALTGSADHTASFWDMDTGFRRGTPLLHSGKVWSVDISPDSRWAITASEDSTAHFWSVDTARGLGPPLTSRGPLRCAVIEPNGRYALTAGLDATVRIWPAPEPLKGLVPRITLWVKVLTGMELDQGGGVRVLEPAEWQHYRQSFLESAAPPLLFTS